MDIASSVRCIAALAGGLIFGVALAQDEVLIIGREGNRCAEDAACFNRIHPDIPMIVQADPGQSIVFKTRNAGDSPLDPGSTYEDSRGEPPYTAAVHPLGREQPYMSGALFVDRCHPLGEEGCGPIAREIYGTSGACLPNPESDAN